MIDPVSPATMHVQRSGHSFRVVPSHPGFWNDFTRESWEPETFALFDHFITPETVHLDVGAWIGPTLLYAATRARLAVGFEPDPVAFQILEQNVAANPGRAPIQLHGCAIAAHRGQLRLGSRSTPGDSMSSALFADQTATWTTEAHRLEEFEPEWPTGAPVFLKIDIEGGEYRLLPALRDFVRRRRPTIYLSLHSDFFMAPYMKRGFALKLIGEFRLLTCFLRSWPILRAYRYVTSLSGERLSARQILHRRTWRRAWGLVMSDRPIPSLRR